MMTVKELLSKVLRPNVLNFAPYSSARLEFSGRGKVFLDANENPFGSPCGETLNRYPDTKQSRLREMVAENLGAEVGEVVLGNGSDELIDLLVRACVRPGKDEVWVTTPSYGMYGVSAALQEAILREIPLTNDYQLPPSSQSFSEFAKLLFLCSPNNPTGNSLKKESVLEYIKCFPGLVVIDEAYGDFSEQPSFINEIKKIPNLVVLRTFSKSWGLAGARVGVGVMNPELVSYIDRIKPPYNVNDLSARALASALQHRAWNKECILRSKEERRWLFEKLQRLPSVIRIYPSDANFLLCKVHNAKGLYAYLQAKGIVVRDRSGQRGCEGCLRITVGTRKENELLITALSEYREIADIGDRL